MGSSTSLANGAASSACSAVVDGMHAANWVAWAAVALQKERVEVSTSSAVVSASALRGILKILGMKVDASATW